jgi:NAD+ synthase (glutamine-hydrolysing)
MRMRIAIAQLNSTPGDFDATVAKMGALSRRAKDLGAELVVFPLTSLDGTEHKGPLVIPELFIALMGAMSRLADELAIPAIVPLVVVGGERPLIELELIKDGRIERHAFDGYRPTGTADEGDRLITFGFDGLSFGAAFDMQDLDDYARGASSVDVILYLPLDSSNANHEETYLAPSVSDGYFVNEAADANAWIVAAGAAGGYDELVYPGGSFVMAPWGELACVAPSFEEALVSAEVDPSDEGPLPSPVAPPAYHRMRLLWDTLVAGTRDFFDKEGIRDVGLVLEGDLCSSVTAAVLVDALGPVRVHAVAATPPDAAAASDALLLAQNLHIDCIQAPAEVPASKGIGWRELAGALLASLSRERSWATASSSDKTGLALEPERHMGAAAWAPLGDVYRTDVAGLVRYRVTVSPVIPASAIARLDVPRVEGSERAGVGEERLLSIYDAVLLGYVDQGRGLAEVSERLSMPELAAGVIARLNAGEACRRPMPSFPIVGDVTLEERDWPCGTEWGALEGTLPDGDQMEIGMRLAEQLVDGGAAPGMKSGAPAAEPAQPPRPRDFPAYMRDLIEMGLMQEEMPETGSGEDDHDDDEGDGPLFASGFFSEN